MAPFRLLVLSAGLALLPVAFAQEPPSSMNVEVTVNGSPVSFPEAGPIMKEGRVFVPAKAVADRFGAKFVPNADGKSGSLVKGSTRYAVADASQVRLRDLARAFGGKLTYDAQIRSAGVTLPTDSQPSTGGSRPQTMTNTGGSTGQGGSTGTSATTAGTPTPAPTPGTPTPSGTGAYSPDTNGTNAYSPDANGSAAYTPDTNGTAAYAPDAAKTYAPDVAGTTKPPMTTTPTPVADSAETAGSTPWLWIAIGVVAIAAIAFFLMQQKSSGKVIAADPDRNPK